ncbi:hypothetical protein DSM106972_099130 [Dulcicalothrix desertica PCC 7102]|uniref:TRADD-like N-terminal domain-containing protein n=1 Tax=Dulcicalothrix desertica PCC 7102 TaxID=232991 RepID=A0A3S5K2M1_9CYAN|nr:helix-turn-helix transcriptional regulator [Dulcicalothrix desertica]RUS92416.1 hypothetical protein DSM106972_099130 [Dulcicalothrix desertica PCC 7102]TWH62839.1 hypothetical protein CAL7102_00374 [Dulcicalothrix desertica PCC 7102]
MPRSYKISKAGLEKAKKAFEIKGWTQEYLAGRTNCTRQVVSKFFGRGSVEKRFFQAICTELLLDWGEIADLDSEEKEDIKPSDRNMKHAVQTASMVLQEKDEVIQQSSSYPELTTQGQKRLGYAIVGSVDKVDVQKLKTIVALLQSITGDTSIEIVGIEEGSIKLILEGSQESLEKIKSLFKAGELTEISGIPIVDVQFLSTEIWSKKRLAFTITSNISEVDMQKLRNAFIKENISQAPINQNFITYSDNPGYRAKSERISIGGGNYNEVNQGSYIQGNYDATGQPQSLVQAAGEIQALLKQLESNYPSNTPARHMVVAMEVLKHLESSPTMKQRVINAVKEGGLAAFEKAIDNPAGAFIIGAVKGWQEVKDS